MRKSMWFVGTPNLPGNEPPPLSARGSPKTGAWEKVGMVQASLVLSQRESCFFVGLAFGVMCVVR